MSHRLASEHIRSQGVLTDAALEELARQGVIDPFDPDLLSGCCYDLRTGRTLRSRNRGRTFNLESGEYYIESGECVTVQTLERIDFSNVLLFGIITNKHSVLARGIVHPITKVDPGFCGHLAVTLFNHGHVAEPIRFEQPLVALIVKPLTNVPVRVYGASQAPSYRQGDIDIASIVNEPAEPLDDAALGRMYGRPVSRLYERIQAVERSIEVGMIKQGRDTRARRTDIAWRFAVGFTGAAIALAGNYLLNHWKDIFG